MAKNKKGVARNNEGVAINRRVLTRKNKRLPVNPHMLALIKDKKALHQLFYMVPTVVAVRLEDEHPDANLSESTSTRPTPSTSSSDPTTSTSGSNPTTSTTGSDPTTSVARPKKRPSTKSPERSRQSVSPICAINREAKKIIRSVIFFDTVFYLVIWKSDPEDGDFIQEKTVKTLWPDLLNAYKKLKRPHFVMDEFPDDF